MEKLHRDTTIENVFFEQILVASKPTDEGSCVEKTVEKTAFACLDAVDLRESFSVFSLGA